MSDSKFLGTLTELLNRDGAISVSFHSPLVAPQPRAVTYVTKGKGDWVKGHGATIEAALDDLIQQLDSGNPRAYEYQEPEVETPTVPGMTTRMPG